MNFQNMESLTYFNLFSAVAPAQVKEQEVKLLHSQELWLDSVLPPGAEHGLNFTK